MKFFISILCLFIVAGELAYSGNFPFFGKRVTDPGFIVTDSVMATPVANQYKTNTCWSFATLSFLESELLRTTGNTYNFSEMYIVRKAYEAKAERYIRMKGTINFAGGGEPNDVLNVIRLHGAMPEDAYTGLTGDALNHIHIQMDEALKNYVAGIVKNPSKLDQDWRIGFNKILDNYLGELPESFMHAGEKTTPTEFANELELSTSDYVMISSFLHHPFYEPFILEVPDNWSWGEVYNVPLIELRQIADSAIDKGYSIAWAADISEKGFSFSEGVAVVPEQIYASEQGEYSKKIEKMHAEEFTQKFLKDIPNMRQVAVTPGLRQKAFDELKTTDDHGMHITGIAKDANGNSYYYVKNSWGTGNKYNGYLFVSVPYFEFKTISIMVHKDAIPAQIRAKLRL